MHSLIVHVRQDACSPCVWLVQSVLLFGYLCLQVSEVSGKTAPTPIRLQEIQLCETVQSGIIINDIYSSARECYHLAALIYLYSNTAWCNLCGNELSGVES